MGGGLGYEEDQALLVEARDLVLRVCDPVKSPEAREKCAIEFLVKAFDAGRKKERWEAAVRIHGEEHGR